MSKKPNKYIEVGKLKFKRKDDEGFIYELIINGLHFHNMKVYAEDVSKWAGYCVSIISGSEEPFRHLWGTIYGNTENEVAKVMMGHYLKYLVQLDKHHTRESRKINKKLNILRDKLSNA